MVIYIKYKLYLLNNIILIKEIRKIKKLFKLFKNIFNHTFYIFIDYFF